MPAQVGRADRHVVLRLQRPVGRWSVRRLAAAIARARREPPEVVVVDLSEWATSTSAVPHGRRMGRTEDVVLVSPEVDRTWAILHEARPDLEVPPVFPTVDAALTALDRRTTRPGRRGSGTRRPPTVAARSTRGGGAVRGRLDADEVVIAALPAKRFADPPPAWAGRPPGALIGPSSTRNPAMAIPCSHEPSGTPSRDSRCGSWPSRPGKGPVLSSCSSASTRSPRRPGVR